MSIKQIFDPIFTQNYYYIKAKSLTAYHRELKKEFDFVAVDAPSVTGKFRAIEKKGQSIGVIWAIEGRLDIVVHECLHATFWGLCRRGLNLNEESEEAFCYVLQFLIKEILSNKTDNRIKIRRV